MMGDPLPLTLEAIERYSARFCAHGADDFAEFAGFMAKMDSEWFAERKRAGG